jgi:glycosyltransferase involved in cell wall biosynthesis
MRIGIDVSMIDTTKAGIGSYANSIVVALSSIDKSNEYYLFTHNRALLSNVQLSQNFNIIEVQSTSGNLMWMLKSLPTIQKLKLDRFFSPSNLFWGCVLKNCITVVHDIAQILHPEFFAKKGNILYKLELALLLRKNGIIVTPSNAVKNELESKYKNIKPKVKVIGAGLHDWVLVKSNDEDKTRVKKTYNLPSNYILSVGTLEPRKNLVNTILGFKYAKELFNKEDRYKNLKLVIVGKKGWFYDEIFRTVNNNGLDKDIVFLGYVPDHDLPSIYDLSEFVVNLSFYEGFGLPLIEANARGKFLLISNIAAYSELEVSSVKIEPTASHQEIGKAMYATSGWQFEPEKKFFDTYSWNTTAKRLIELFK